MSANAENPDATFEWDPRKAVSNLRKHRVSFTEALTTFADRLSVAIPDPDNSAGEERAILIGSSSRGRLVVVVFVEQNSEFASSAPGPRPGAKGESMKKVSEEDRPMRAEYDFRGGIRGKYAARFRNGAIAVVLDPDVATVFADADSVNRALRSLAEIIARQSRSKDVRKPAKRATGSARRVPTSGPARG